jgi:hypothetical protein
MNFTESDKPERAGPGKFNLLLPVGEIENNRFRAIIDEIGYDGNWLVSIKLKIGIDILIQSDGIGFTYSHFPA